MRRTTPFEPAEPAPPLNLFHTQSKDGTPKGLTLNPETLYLTSHLCYAIGNSEPLTVHDFQETRSFL